MACALVVVLGGCAQQETSRVDAARLAYQAGNYEGAYTHAKQQLMRSGSDLVRQDAAYMAGVSAYQLNQHSRAREHLMQAAQSQDPMLAADAWIMLGLIDKRLGRLQPAGRAFLNAAQRLPDGPDRANAYLHAAQAQRQLGHWAQARASLILARSSSSDPRFRRMVNQEMGVTGFTLQAGAFTSRSNAVQAAQALAEVTSQLGLGTPRLLPATDAQGRAWFLVQAGQFSTYASALVAQKKLGQAAALVVPLAGQR